MDASAIVAWLLNERGAAAVGRLLQFAVLPAPNVTESIRTARTRGHGMTSGQLYARLEASCAVVEPFLDVDALWAAELLLFADRQAEAKLSLGDALCIAVAERLQLPLVGDDELWAQLPLEVD
ncbi:MAG TPA: PIN domain-containing protein, partial [Micromonosporaceae bacterium]|nr:PIN domain-containing protein [Micromonosporaceae bacterium]